MYCLKSADTMVIKMLMGMPANIGEIQTEADFQQLYQKIGDIELSYDLPVKCSCYNYCVGRDGQYVVFNTLCSSLYKLQSEEEYQIYLGKLPPTDEQRREFINSGFWVRQDLEEKEAYLAFMAVCHKYRRHNVSLVLTTTLRCNARCVYCYESGIKQQDFDRGNIEKLISFLKAQDLSHGLEIIWFGGEPLLNESFIDELSARLESENIVFSGYLISNGSLLNEQIIEHKLTAWHLKHLQVTVDGTEEKYEAIKRYVDGNTGHYYSILRNLKKVTREGIAVHLRLNISEDNKEDMLELVEELEAIFADCSDVTMYPAFVTGIENVVPEEERVPLLKRILGRLKDSQKMTFAGKFYGLPRITPCHRFSSRAFAIDAMGNIFACEHLVGRQEKRIGDLTSGLYERDSRLDGVPLKEECKECVFLPKCCGGCQSNRDDGDIPCMIERYMIPAYMEYLLG